MVSFFGTRGFNLMTKFLLAIESKINYRISVHVFT